MRARAPASSANLGPGFDALAVALGLYVTVDVRPADVLTVTSAGHGSDLAGGSEHLAARVAIAVAGHDRLAIHVESEIPVGRGLGSSAALAVAAAAAAGCDADGALVRGAAADGHPENAAASTHGGLVAAAVVDGSPIARRLPLDPDLRFCVVVPDRELRTVDARAALAVEIPRADAVFNISRMGLLIAGLADHRRLVAAAMEDRLHQAARGRLFPQAASIIAGLMDAGALSACWSGAGPSVLAVSTGAALAAVREAGQRLLTEHEIPGQAVAVTADTGGVTVLEGSAK